MSEAILSKNRQLLKKVSAEGSPRGPVSRLLRVADIQRSEWTVIFVYAAALGVLSLAVPMAVQAIVNYAVMGGIVQPVVAISVLLTAALAGTVLLRALQTQVVEMLQRRMFRRVVMMLCDHLPRIRLRTWRERGASETYNRYFDLFTVQKATVSLLVDALDAFVVAVVGIIVLAFYHPALLAFDLLLILSLTVFLWLTGRGAIATSIGESKAKYRVAEWFQAHARQYEIAKFPRRQAYARQELVERAANYLERRDDHFRIFLRQLVCAWSIQAVAMVTLLVIGTWLVTENQLSIGQLVAAELIVTALAASIRKLALKAEIFYDAVAAGEKVHQLLELELESEDVIDPVAEVRDQTRVLENVCATASRAAPLTARLEPGEHYFVLAPVDESNGLAAVLAGLERPASGQFTVGGYDIRDVTLSAVRAATHYVTYPRSRVQTIEDCLRTAGATSDSKAHWQALREVGLESFVRNLPDGLDTLLGSRGEPLSRRQLVLLQFAEALIGHEPVLLVDTVIDELPTADRTRIFDMLGDQRRMVIVTSAVHPKCPDGWQAIDLREGGR